MPTDELTTYLNQLIEDNIGLADLEAAITAAEPVTDPDGKQRPRVEAADFPRGYWNIRDKAEGNPVAARDLAEWAMRKHQANEDAIAEVQATADRQRAQIAEWEQKQTRKLEREVDFFEFLLDEYQRDFHTDEKTTSLIGGKIKRRAMPPVTERNEEAALAWALERGDETLLKYSVNLAALKQRLEKQADGTFKDADTGEVVPWQHEVPNPIPYRLTIEHSDAS